MTGREPPLPAGFRLEPDGTSRWSADGLAIYGGRPWRLLRFNTVAARVSERLLAGEPVADDRDGVVARRLVRAGLAHPVAPAAVTIDEVDVVVPVFGRPATLDNCLSSLRLPGRVLVVDDGSPDASSVAAVAERHGAGVVRLERNHGPAAARNAGVQATTAPLVAFVDSDAIVDAASIEELARHFADPVVGAVAPRVTAARRRNGRTGLLDLGDAPANVRPGGRVGYVPSAVLLVRRSALAAVGGFDPVLRVGEDVDMVWRLVEAGWSVRYDPSVIAEHDEPGWPGGLRRRFAYGTSAGALARRHPGRLRGPAVAGLWPGGRLRRTELPDDVAEALCRQLPRRTLRGLRDWAAPVWCPWLKLVDGDVAGAADAAAYGLGVWVGSVRARTLEPLLPRWTSTGDGGTRAHDDARAQVWSEPAEHPHHAVS